MKIIPYGHQSISKKDIKAVIKVLKSSNLTQGPKIEEFESKLSNYLGTKYVVVVSSATAALHLAVLSLNITKGMQGITSPISFLASANTFIYNGLKPVFADIEYETYNIDPEEIKKKISKKTKVIIPVHFTGQVCDMKKIYELAKNKGITVIEDAAHAIGSRYENGEKVGSCCYSDMTVFSFHPVKTITSAEGGAISTNSKLLYQRLKILRSHGIVKEKKLLSENPGPWYYEMQQLGFNYRLTDLQSALGSSQLDRIDEFISKRRKIIERYNIAFGNVSWIKIPKEIKNVFSVRHLYVLLIDFKKIKKSRKQVMLELEKKGIGTQVHYIPIHLQPYYRNNYGYKKGDYPKAENYYEKCLTIPLFPAMTDSDVNKVIKAVLNLSST